MKKILFMLIILGMAGIGCASSVATKGVETIDSASLGRTTLYLYSSGSGERLRVALVKSPESDVEVVPYTVQIVTAAGSFDDAVKFMERGGWLRKIVFSEVLLKGKRVGYLLTPSQQALKRDYLEVNIFERNGKVYLAINEKIYD